MPQSFRFPTFSFPSLWEVTSTGLLPSGSHFVCTFSQLPHGRVIPCLCWNSSCWLGLFLHIINHSCPTLHRWWQTPPPGPHPTLGITRKIYSKAVSKSYCWKYWIDLESGPQLGRSPQKALWLWHWILRIGNLNRLQFLGSLMRMSSGTVPEASPKSRLITSSAVPP